MASLALYDITGRSIASRNIALQAGSSTNVDLNSIAPALPVGVYNLRLQLADTFVNRRIVVSQ